MQALLSADFWLDQTASAYKAWAIFIPFILAFFALFKIRLAKLENQNRELRAHSEVVDSRLQLAREANSGAAETIGEIQNQIHELRELIRVEKSPTVIEPIIKEVDASAATLVMANRTADHILTAERPAISDTYGRHFSRSNSVEQAPTVLMILISVVAFGLLVIFGIGAG